MFWPCLRCTQHLTSDWLVSSTKQIEYTPAQTLGMVDDHSLFYTLLAGAIPSDVLVSIAAAGTQEAETAPPHVAQYALAFIHICINLQKAQTTCMRFLQNIALCDPHALQTWHTACSMIAASRPGCWVASLATLSYFEGMLSRHEGLYQSCPASGLGAAAPQAYSLRAPSSSPQSAHQLMKYLTSGQSVHR